MDRCPKDELTTKNLVWNKSSSHSREKLEKPVGGRGWPPLAIGGLRKPCLRSMGDEIEIVGGTTLALFLAGEKEWKHRGPCEKRKKDWWTNGYQNWSDEALRNA